jgi:hypothetical protein
MRELFATNPHESAARRAFSFMENKRYGKEPRYIDGVVNPTAVPFTKPTRF